MESILRAHHLEQSDIEPEALHMCLSGLYDTEAMERVARISATNKYLNSHGYPGLPLFPAKKSIWDNNGTPPTTSNTILNSTNNNTSEEVSNIAEPKKKRIRKSKIDNNPKNDDVSVKDCTPSMPTVAPNTHLPPSVLECMNEEDIQKGSKMGLNTEEYFIIKGNYGKLFDLELDQSSFYHMMKKCKTKIAIKMRSNREKSIAYLKKQLLQLARFKLRLFDRSNSTAHITSSSTTDSSSDVKEKETSTSTEDGGNSNTLSLPQKDKKIRKGKMKHATDFLKVMMAMHPPLPQLSPYTTANPKPI